VQGLERQREQQAPHPQELGGGDAAPLAACAVPALHPPVRFRCILCVFTDITYSSQFSAPFLSIQRLEVPHDHGRASRLAWRREALQALHQLQDLDPCSLLRRYVLQASVGQLQGAGTVICETCVISLASTSILLAWQVCAAGHCGAAAGRGSRLAAAGAVRRFWHRQAGFQCRGRRPQGLARRLAVARRQARRDLPTARHQVRELKQQLAEGAGVTCRSGVQVSGCRRPGNRSCNRLRSCGQFAESHTRACGKSA